MSHDPAILVGGPDFDLSLELGAAGDDAHVAAALSALWTCPLVDGPWADAGAIGVADQQGPVSEWLDTKRWRFGCLRMNAISRSIPFMVRHVREQHAPAEQLAAKTQEPSDWLTFAIPVGVLRSAWSVDNSWITDNQPWLRDLCLLLAGIADHVHHGVRSVAGVMGEEASGCWRNPTSARALAAHQGYPPLAVMTAEVIEARGGFVLPIALWKRLAPSVDPCIMPSGLHYVPPRPNARLTGA